MLQLNSLFKDIDHLHQIYGDKDYTPIYGAGEIKSPKFFLIFMNPTAKNISASKEWTGLKAPWLGTKNVWRLMYDLEFLKDANLYRDIRTMKPEEWDYDFSVKLYEHMASNSVYLTNIAKCTQPDARALPDSTYRAYLTIMQKELELIKPKYVITFGNQVSSILLDRKISVSKYIDDTSESFSTTDKTFKIYPTYYPVGQGMRNMPRARERIRAILSSKI